MGLELIVDCQISSTSANVTQVGFGTLLIVGTHTRFTDRIRFYTNVAGMVSDGFAPTDPEYIAANAAFSQTPSPTTVAIGRRISPETFDVTMAAIYAANPNWYGVVITSRLIADVQAVAGWVEANTKMFITASSDPNVLLTSSTTDVAAVINLANYKRTAVLYSGAVAAFPDAAWFGQLLPQAPGSATYKFKVLSGITADALSPTQSLGALGKNANTFETIAGVSITQNGTVGVGEYIDKMVGIDWMQQRIKERIYSRLVNNPKIPYTDAGGAVLENEIRAQLRQGIAAGFLTNNPEPTVFVPRAIDQASTDRGNRYFPGITFLAYVAGAIHKLQIKGTISV